LGGASLGLVLVVALGFPHGTVRAGDGITLELPKTHPVVARVATSETIRRDCAGPKEPRVQVVIQQFNSPGLEGQSGAKVVDYRADEINARIEKVNDALAAYPAKKQTAGLSDRTKESLLAKADRRLKQRLDQYGAVLFVGVDKKQLKRKETLDMYERLGVVTDLSILGLCQTPAKDNK